ncbi:S9 family peptidase [Paenibacillus sp. MMS18-CY102]|uniref:S9 family peptidase n=1 Tax=Paenibacillus sp. MMS18-CY102 TaxID=2682849 RepID=UPI0013663A89|nr:prolyl oligopeptidase family serine peptidase [Paenibacillus sp. MMS18-CY102]MWC28572.1 prolyl oligopeptidase family serine peptidase [Paenibacillus sp. MMS18-CY102]
MNSVRSKRLSRWVVVLLALALLLPAIPAAAQAGNGALTRGDAAVLLQQTLGLEAPAAQDSFADVGVSDKAASAIYALKQQGIVKGDAKGFKPNDPLTREQMASLIVRAFGLHDNGIQVTYKDAQKIGKAHQADAVRLKQYFVVEGLAFDPKHHVNANEFVTALERAAGSDVEKEGSIPLTDLFRQPAQFSFQASPDGKKIGYIQPWNNRLNVFVKQAGSNEAVQVTKETDNNIAGFVWKTDNTLLYAMDNGGDENYHIYKINADGTGRKDLTPYANTRALLVDGLADQPGYLLVALNKRDPRVFDVYRLNMESGALELVAENPGNISGWMTDHDGKLRVAIASDGIISSVLYRETEDKPFEELYTTNVGDQFSPIMFTYDNKQLYALSNVGRDKAAIVQFDPAAKKAVKTVYENADVDVSGIFFSNKTKQVTGGYYTSDKVHYEFTDADWKAKYERLQAKLPGKSISFLSIDDNLENVMILAYSDRAMGTYYAYDAKADKLTLIADTAPWLKEDSLAEVKPVTYQARDGLTIHGYLTLPKGADPKNLPLVVNPHGGPWARDEWGFNPEVQLLANRGYAVLQVNFRGSIGYGKAFLDAGNKQWGKAMQDDLTDGVKWLVGQGIVNKDKVAIYGASYGGYAALAGLAFTPDVYAAGVSYVGPSNLFTLLETIPPYWSTQLQEFYTRMGDPVKDKDLLTAVSPLFHVDQIKAPLFVAQGQNDPRVKQAESDQIVKALTDRGIDVPYMLKANEGHGFALPENQLDFYLALERFLHRHLME